MDDIRFRLDESWLKEQSHIRSLNKEHTQALLDTKIRTRIEKCNKLYTKDLNDYLDHFLLVADLEMCDWDKLETLMKQWSRVSIASTRSIKSILYNLYNMEGSDQ